MIKQRLELDWIGKDDEVILEPRILLPDKEKGVNSSESKNLLIHGDNLLALRALEGEFTSKFRCVYIDPPYNTGAAFEHYEDGIEHSVWLSMMQARLKLIHKLIAENGSLWVQLDDNEVHYCKVMLDEIFGRKNFVTSIVWQKVFAKKNKALISGSHDTILVYAKDISKWQRNLIPRSGDQLKAFKNPDNDPRGPWQSVSYSVQSEDSEKRAAYRYEITTPSGAKAKPPQGRHWNGMPDRTATLIKENKLWFGPNGDKSPRIKVFLDEVQDGIVPDTWWNHEDTGNNQEAKKEILELFEGDEPFNTPKPERLIHRILQIATNPGDWVLDSFLGSGTTCAVAHKMKRNWVGIEQGDHCFSCCLPRITKVVQGKEAIGVTESLGWQGGGGFKFMTLAPSLLEKDDRGNWVISKKYDATMLAAAVCKHEGFKFHPDQKTYWKQGYSTEKDFIFVTTQFLTTEQIQRIQDQMKPDENLLICAKAFKVPANKFDRVTIKKIPQSLLNRGVEFGRDEYSLNVKVPIQEEMDIESDT